MSLPAAVVLDALWRSLDLPADALTRASLTGAEPVLPSSFAVGTAAQVSTAAAALAATEIGRSRNGLVQSVAVDMREAALECRGHFTIDGKNLELWDPIAGLYRCADAERGGWVRIHTNFAHHRDGVLRLLGLPSGPETPRAAVAQALAGWKALEFERVAADAGMVVAALRSADEWARHPQSAAVAELPLIAIERIGDAAPLSWPELPQDAPPLTGLKILDLTRILAGPVGTRTLAAYGADVMLVNSPKLPNIGAIADTSRGKRSALADLRTTEGRDGLRRVLTDAHVFVQGYRPGGLSALGFGISQLAEMRPGLVSVSLSAYGETGPWGGRRGFDSLVQTATGFNRDEADSAGSAEPKAMPIQILDMATGLLIALGSQAALLRQQSQGGSWHVTLSLARTAQWLRELGRVEHGFEASTFADQPTLQRWPSSYGELMAPAHAARFSHTPVTWTRPSVPPGTDPLAW
jgi:crotonobetainyl-CoA:carnitine CoA-transferase CaiB-like acyl-CoA transferase